MNGPNLNLLGSREPDIYGKTSLQEIVRLVTQTLDERGIMLEAFQSNTEGELINWLHERRDAGFLLLNPGALTHTSIALRDAILGVGIPFIEVHLSNVHQREPFRHQSYFSDIATGILVGLGVNGYLLAAEFAADYLQTELQSS